MSPARYFPKPAPSARQMRRAAEAKARKGKVHSLGELLSSAGSMDARPGARAEGFRIARKMGQMGEPTKRPTE